MNCLTDECWKLKEDSLTGKLICTENNIDITDTVDLIENCPNYTPIESCPTCRYHSAYIYETGTVDGVGYSCSLQNGKEVYQDVKPMGSDYADVPKCPIDRYVR